MKEAGRKPRRRRLAGKRGRGTSADEKNPVLGIVERGGCVSLQVLPNIQQVTIKPVIEAVVTQGATFYTDEYNIYNKVTDWGYTHKTVNHGAGEYARDGDGDGKYEVHCNTQEGVWSLLRARLRPHRGVSQEKLPFYVGYFEWIYNLKRRGKAAMDETFALLFMPDLRSYDDCLINSQY